MDYRHRIRSGYFMYSAGAAEREAESVNLAMQRMAYS
jgi:hypothetical protein